MKSPSYKIFIIILAGAFIILISLCLLSRKPTVDQDTIDVKTAAMQVRNGESSEEIMKGVRVLLGVLKKDSNNVDAIWELGLLSLQSEQYPKAINRFEKFVSLTTGENKVSGLINLSDAYFMANKKEKSLESLMLASSINENSEVEAEIQERINIINKN